jgi:hypothetical protein
MFWQRFFPLVNFPYKEAIESWKSENKLVWWLTNHDSFTIVSFETWPNSQSFMNPSSFHDVKLIF